MGFFLVCINESTEQRVDKQMDISYPIGESAVLHNAHCTMYMHKHTYLNHGDFILTDDLLSVSNWERTSVGLL